MKITKLRIGLLISGGGTTAQAIMQACQSGRLKHVVPACVIASRPDAGGIVKAQEAGIETVVVDRRACNSREEFGDHLLHACKPFDLDVVGQYGFIPLTPPAFIEYYAGRIVNQHPAPLDTGFPDFGGKGMYGRAAHAARLYFVRATERAFWTEATAHHVTKELDEGSVIHTRTVPILPTDSVFDLQQRVLPVEHQVQIEAIELFAQGGILPTVKRQERLILPGEENMLALAKQAACYLFPRG